MDVARLVPAPEVADPDPTPGRPALPRRGSKLVSRWASHRLAWLGHLAFAWGRIAAKSDGVDVVSSYRDGMLDSGNVLTFWWYFTGSNIFDGILLKSSPFDATQPIFPLIID